MRFACLFVSFLFVSFVCLVNGLREERLNAERNAAIEAKKNLVKIENLKKTITALKKGAKTPSQLILETYKVTVLVCLPFLVVSYFFQG